MYTNSLALLLPAFFLSAHQAFSLPQQGVAPPPPPSQAPGPEAPPGLPLAQEDLHAKDPPPFVFKHTILENGDTYWTSYESGDHVTGCHNRTQKDGGDLNYSIAMRAKLEEYVHGENPKSNAFQGMDVPELKEGFFLGAADGYTSTSDCANACYTCMTESIAAGSRDTVCWDVYSAHKNSKVWTVDGWTESSEKSWGDNVRRCWMGFHATG